MAEKKIYVIRRDHPDIARIECYPWAGDYRPRAEAFVRWDDLGLHVRMTAWEETIIARERRVGGAVSKDSCLEFFFQPMPARDPGYINCEINPGAVMHVGVGKGRERRDVQLALPPGMEPRCETRRGEWWLAEYTVPTQFVARWFPGWKPKSGLRMRGNFYACDESLHPHFGCWSPIRARQPDFHTPNDFGELILE